MSSFVWPSDNPQVRRVESFDELITTRFEGGVNALCWQRHLSGDFGEVVSHLDAGELIMPLDEATLLALPLSSAGRHAVAIMLEDHRRLREAGLDPSLDCIRAYPRDDDNQGLRTDVYSFHCDSATTEADTYLCTYHGPSSEGVMNDEAIRRIEVPETRAELLRVYGGKDDALFQEYLRDQCYDHHFIALPHARPFSFGLGNLWRIAVDYPGCPVLPCIHRAPETKPDDPPRLLLIS